MARKRFRAEQIIMKLREAEVGLARGKSARQVCKPESVHQMQKGITCLTPQNSLWPLSVLLTPRTTNVSMSFPPSGCAIIAAPQESLNTLTTVRHMSSGQFDREYRAHNQFHLWPSQIDGLQNDKNDD